jgi:hypothetical protein
MRDPPSSSLHPLFDFGAFMPHIVYCLALYLATVDSYTSLLDHEGVLQVSSLSPLLLTVALYTLYCLLLLCICYCLLTHTYLSIAACLGANP